jgi:hypothetical protein
LTHRNAQICGQGGAGLLQRPAMRP